MSTADELAKLHELLKSGALTPEEFEREKARLLMRGTSGSPSQSSSEPSINALRLSGTDRWIGGVCGGIARATGVDAWVWRLLFVLLLLPTGFLMGLIYLLLWVFVPRDEQTP